MERGLEVDRGRTQRLVPADLSTLRGLLVVRFFYRRNQKRRSRGLRWRSEETYLWLLIVGV